MGTFETESGRVWAVFYEYETRLAVYLVHKFRVWIVLFKFTYITSGFGNELFEMQNLSTHESPYLLQTRILPETKKL